MSQSEDSESGGNTSGSAMASGSSARKIAAQDQAGLRTTPVVEWSIQQVAAYFQSQGIEDAVVQRTVGEMIAGVELLALQNDDLRELGITKMGPRKKLLTNIAKLKARGAAALDESSTTQTVEMSDGNDDESSSGAAHVTVTALFKKKKSVLKVGSHITLENLLLQLSQAFGCRVKVKLEDDDGDQIPITSDQELADALAGEDEVTLQAFKDLKWRAATTASGKKGSAVAVSGKSSSSAAAAGADVVAEFADRYAMFDELLDPYIVIDSEGTVLAFNPSAEKLLGYAKKKVLGKNVKMLMPDTYAKKHDSYLAKYNRTGVKTVIDSKRTVMAKASSGDMIAVELGVTEKEIGDSSHFVGCLRTATGAGNATDDSDASASGTVVSDVKIDKTMRKNMLALQEAAIIITAEGRICLFNKAAENMFGHTAQAVVGGPIEVLMGSPHKCNHAYYLQRYVATGEARVMNSSRNVQAKHKAGHWLDINLALSESETEDGEQIFIGLMTANKQIAHKAGASSVLKAGTLLQMTRQMISSMTVPGIIISESGVIQAFNREAEKLLGYTLIDVVGRNVSMLMNDDDAAKHDGYLARYMATRESAIIGAGKGRTVVAKHKSGKHFNMHLSIVEQEDEAGKKLFTGMLHKTKSELAEIKGKRKSKKAVKAKKEEDDDSV